MRLTTQLKTIRKSRKLSQRELAEKCGISVQAMNSIELGKSVPKVSIAIKISQLLKKPVEKIFKIHE